MSAILGNKVGVYVSGTAILAESINISQTNTVTNKYFLGANTTNHTSPQGPYNTTVSINYLPLLEEDPNYHILTSLKSIRSGAGVSINAGGITGLFYLTNYSFKIQPNSPIFVTCQYSCFNNLTGRPTGLQFDIPGNINSGIGTACSITWAGSTDEIDDIYSLDYQAAITWRPSYKIGQKEPYRVTYLSIEETYTMETNQSRFIDFYGNTVGQVLSGYSTLSLYPAINIASSPQVYSLLGAKVTNISIPISNGDVIRNRYSFTKNY